MPAICSAPSQQVGPTHPWIPPVVRGALHTADIGDNSSISTGRQSTVKTVVVGPTMAVKKMSFTNPRPTCPLQHQSVPHRPTRFQSVIHALINQHYWVPFTSHRLHSLFRVPSQNLYPTRLSMKSNKWHSQDFATCITFSMYRTCLSHTCGPVAIKTRCECVCFWIC
jgi:hypothetical protein